MLSVSGETESLDTVHHVTAYLGDVIGAITLTGSVVAFLKLQGIAPSAPLNLPGEEGGGAAIVYTTSMCVRQRVFNVL